MLLVRFVNIKIRNWLINKTNTWCVISVYSYDRYDLENRVHWTGSVYFWKLFTIYEVLDNRLSENEGVNIIQCS